MFQQQEERVDWTWLGGRAEHVMFKKIAVPSRKTHSRSKQVRDQIRDPQKRAWNSSICPHPARALCSRCCYTVKVLTPALTERALWILPRSHTGFAHDPVVYGWPRAREWLRTSGVRLQEGPLRAFQWRGFALPQAENHLPKHWLLVIIAKQTLREHFRLCLRKNSVSLDVKFWALSLK